MSVKDGGPAFPGPCQSEQSVDINEGLSLRDYFAAKAMQGFAADPESHTLFDDADDVARSAYDVADAMLKARSP